MSRMFQLYFLSMCLFSLLSPVHNKSLLPRPCAVSRCERRPRRFHGDVGPEARTVGQSAPLFKALRAQLQSWAILKVSCV